MEGKKGTNVYIDDLPMGTTDAFLSQVCGLYGTVTWVKVSPSKDNTTCFGIVELESEEDAKWFVENINGNIPQGLTTPIRASLRKEKKTKGYGKSSDGGGKFGGKGFSPYGGTSKGGKQAAWQPNGGGKGGMQQPVTAESIAGFVAQWGLDDKAQQALLCLDPEAQQRVMTDFSPSDMSRANPMFMGFVKSVSGTRGPPTAQQDYGAMSAFVAQWGLDDKAQQALLCLDPQTQQRVMSDFRPPDMSRANQIFMGFLKSVSSRRGAPSAQEAYGAMDKTKNVYINDLPAEVDESMCKDICGQYGTVTWLKLLPAKGKPTSSAIVEFSTIEESKWFVENLNGNVPSGLFSPIQAYFKK